ncbi:MAG TPA: hypothetical protein VFG91_04255 [Woeseiaceae bacterium]|nr:hypothetical protein [Woeseiaceae bacterium]
MPEDKPKTERHKETFLESLESRLRETANLGHVLATEPRAFPGAIGRVLKRFVRTLWNARGGGLYACGFVVTFLWLEATAFVGQLVASGSLAGFLSSQLFEFVVRFTVQSLTNTVLAFIWPVYLIQLSPLWGGIALAALYVLFPLYIKDPLTNWLFHDDDETPQKDAL